TLNGQTGGTQSFANGTAGTEPNFSSAGDVHILNLPMAQTAGTTAGLVSNSDYQYFQSKPDGSGTTGYLARWNTTNMLNASIIFDNGTNVGIGTTTPNARLHLHTGNTDSYLKSENTRTEASYNVYEFITGRYSGNTNRSNAIW